MSLLSGLVRRVLPALPRSWLWPVARRYVAGAELEDALQRIAALRASGFGTIIDVLGEGVESVAAAEAAAAEYLRALQQLVRVDPACSISVKPTHLGLKLDVDLCARLLGDLCRRAAADGMRVRVEMEDAPTIDATLEVFGRLREQHGNLGCVLQSRLFRTADDARSLLDGRGGLNVRLVKGIYLEPPSIAWTAAEDISRNYVAVARLLLQGGAFVAFATHDAALAESCLALAPQRGSYEFQCLMGVRTEFAAGLRDRGEPIRVYVPYGRDWHAYSLRRINKNPAIAGHVLRALLGLDR